MQKRTIQRILKWAQTLFITYVILGVVLFMLQEKFLFHPRALPADYNYKFDAPFREINLPVSDKKNINIIQFSVPDSMCRGVVLFFHGNMKNIERYASYAPLFTKNHYEVWMLDYPGFGKSTGERSEQIMYDDAQTLYQMAKARFSADSILLYGKSLGTGIAAYLAATKNCRRLILETPYYSIDAMIDHYAFIYPVSLMTKYHFPTHEFVERMGEPVSIFHGTNDGTVPYKNAKRLMRIAPAGSELITIEKGKHNNLAQFPLFQQKLDSLLKL